MSSDFGSGPWVPMEVTERALVFSWLTIHVNGGAAAELEAALRVPVDVVARRRAELGAQLRGEKPVATEGWDWSRERIEAFLAGVNHGKASTPALTQPAGAGSLMAEWPDSDWRAWERHPQRHDLWREVQAAADAPADPTPPSPSRTSSPSAGPSSSPSAPASSPSAAPGASPTPPARAAAPSSSGAGGGAAPPSAAPAASTAPAGPRPDVEEWRHAAKPTRALGPGPCALCTTPIKFEDLVHTIGYWVAHFHCVKKVTGVGGRVPAAPGPTGPGARVRDMRKRAGITQEKFALAIGCKPARVSECELGRAEFTPDELKQCAAYFGVLSEVLTAPEGDDGKPEELLPVPARQLFNEPDADYRDEDDDDQGH